MRTGSHWLLTLAALTIGVLLTSCTQVPDGSSRIRIQLPDKSSGPLSTRPMAATASTDGSVGKSSWGLSSLSATSDISCYAVAFGGVDTLKADRCLNNAGTELFKINGMSESGVPGSEISLIVPAGSARRFYLFAFKAKPGSSCPALTPGARIEASQFSSPSLIGMTEADIAVGTAEIDIIASLTGAKDIENCGWEFTTPATTPTPTPAPSLSLALSDSTTSITTHARQRTVNVSVAQDSTASKWCLSETQTAAPASGSDPCSGGGGATNGWSTTRPTTYTLSTGDGAKTVYLWTADDNGTVSTTNASASIVLDTVAPSTAVVSLTSPATGSTAYTNAALANLNISSDSEAISWCALEQSSVATAPSTPARTDACFTPLKPTALALGATGVRKVYLYIQDAAGNVSTTAASATIDYQTAAPTAPTLALADPTTGSTTTVRQTTTAVSIGSDTSAVKWCLSATQTTQPSSGTDLCNGGAGPGDGWLTARPTSSSLASGDGLKTLNLWVANIYNNVSATAVTASITLDATPPAIPTVSLADPSTASSAYTNATIVNVSVTGDSGATKWCLIEQASATAAPAAPLYNDSCFVATRPTVVTLGALGIRKIYLYTLDSSGNVSTAAASATIDYQTTAPATPTLTLIDPNTNSSLYIRQASVNLNIGNDTLATKWCVSQTQSTKPGSGSSACAGGNGPLSGWYASRPTNFSVTAGDGTKTVYLWVANAYNNVSASPVTSNITMDTVAPTAPTITLTDPVTNSTSSTNSVNVNISVSGDSGAAKWCLKSLTDVAAPTTPLFNDACWAASRPTSADLAADGNRKVYLYLKDAAENISSPGSALITKTTFAKLAILGAPHINTGSCVAYRVVASDSTGEPTQASVPTTITLTPSGGPALYSDSACTTTASSVTFAKGSTVEKFYAKQTTASNSTISASGSSLTAASFAVNAYSMPAASVLEIAAGERFTCFLLADATVKCSGSSVGSGILGSDDNSTTPILIPGLTGIKNLVAGADFACALLSSGTVKCWGANPIGQLGNGTTNPSMTPVTVTGITTATQLSSSDQHVCALLADSSVKCWGSNEHGETGDGSTTNRTTPGPAISGLGTVAQVVAGRGFSCGVLLDGTVKCWGYNSEGNLGTGAPSADILTPVRVPGLNNVVGLAAAYHGCALFASGSMKCWGPNWSGQLGLNNQTNQSAPIAPTASLTNVMSIAAFPVHTCAVLRDGTARCTGSNYSGQLGNGGTTISNVFVSVTAATGLIQIAGASSQFHTCARKQTGTSVCWGSAALGESGDGVERDVQYPTPIASSPTGFSALGAGYQHMCGIFGTGTPATAKCWGGDLPQRDPLGSGGSVQSAAPLAVNFSGTTGVTAIRGGRLHNCALFNDGSVRCWGENRRGQAGPAYFSEKVSAPAFTVFTSSTPVSQIDAGGSTSCAVLNTGALKCWGANESGQLGDTTLVDRNTPTAVNGLASGVSGVAVGQNHTCAWLTDGTAKCWGKNTSGQLGDGSTTGSLVPVTVTGLTGVSKMVAGAAHTCALVSGGYVKCWGSNSVGTLGDGTFTDRLVPTTVSNISSITSISTKFETTCAMTSGGTVYCWGRNGSYQVTETNKVHQNVPVLVAGIGSTVSQIAVGMENVCVLTTGTPTVKCWGANGRQQSGQSNSPLTGLIYAP